MFQYLKNQIIALLSILGAGYYGIGVLIVGGYAEACDMYLRPSVGIAASITLALVIAVLIYKIVGFGAFFMAPFFAILTILAGQVGFLPGAMENFLNDAALRTMPNEKTVKAHMTPVELYCTEDRYCKFAPITDESLTIFRRDAFLNGYCDRGYDCRPEANRATVTGALISLQLRKEFPEIHGVYLHALDIDRQSLSVDVGGAMDESRAKSLVINICASVQKQKYPAVDIHKVSIQYRVNEYGSWGIKTIVNRRC